MTSPHRVFGTAGVCLHCLVWELINKHSPVWPNDPSHKMYDSEYIVSCLTEVIGQLVAGQPDRKVRRQFIAEVDKAVRDNVHKALETGNFPTGKEVKVQ